mgnify:CR=1 FL=1
MSFDDIAARLKKARGAQQDDTEERSFDFAESYRIRAKMVGVLLRDARAGAARTIEDCARLLRVSVDQIERWEAGEEVPSLPQLELLAYYLDVPVSHFWSTQTLKITREGREHIQPEFISIRARMIGALLRQAREEQGISVEQLAEQVRVQEGELGRVREALTAAEQGRRQEAARVDALRGRIVAHAEDERLEAGRRARDLLHPHDRLGFLDEDLDADPAAEPELGLDLRQQPVDEADVAGVAHLGHEDGIEIGAGALDHRDDVLIGIVRVEVVDADAAHGAPEIQRIERLDDLRPRRHLRRRGDGVLEVEKDVVDIHRRRFRHHPVARTGNGKLAAARPSRSFHRDSSRGFAWRG